VTRDEVSDYCRHSIYQGTVINAGADLEEKVERTLSIEENCLFLEVWPLEYTLQFRDVLLSIRSHCVNPLSAQLDYILPHTHTLLIITDEYHLPQRRLKSGQNWQVIPDLYLTRLVDDNGLDWDERRESTLDEPVVRQHANRAQDNPSPQ